MVFETQKLDLHAAQLREVTHGTLGAVRPLFLAWLPWAWE